MAFLRGWLVLIFLGLVFPALAEEEILFFDSKIVIGPDGALTVTETIEVRAEGRQIRRGILRDFPTQYQLPNGTKVSTTFDVIKVLMDGGDVNWTTERLSNGVRVRIGSRDRFLRPGVYTYEIRYRTERQLYHSETFDELYWNVTGNDWEFPINRARASVLVPQGAEILETRGFTGYQREKGQAFEIEKKSARRVIFETNAPLKPGQGLTIVVTWPKDFVSRPTAAEEAVYFFEDNLPIIIGYLGFILVLLYFYLAWKQVGKDPEGGPVIAQYEPPKGVSPGAMSYVEKRSYRQRAFTAAIISMATKGFLEIIEKGKKKFVLKKTGEGVQLAEGERAIANKLFGGLQTEIITDQKNHRDFRAAMKAQEKVLEKNHEGINFIRNQKHFWIGAGISIVFVLLTMLASAGAGGMEALLGFGFIGLYGLILLVMRKRALVLFSSGQIGRKIAVVFAFVFIGVHFMGMAGAVVFDNVFVIVPFVLILAVNVLFYNLLEKPTLEGRKLLDEIEGFKKYLTLAEKERLDFHTGAITPEVFEEYLPYAIALGVENTWGKNFEAEMVKAGQDPARYQPVWYHGGRYYGFSGRSNFGSAFGAAFAGSVAAASSPPSKGGSGGGGFSGGGGGGGGGGGW